MNFKFAGIPRRLSRSTVLIVFVLVGLCAGGLIATAVSVTQSGGGSQPPLDVPQTATASDTGLDFHVTRAAFSGSATFVEVSVKATGAAADVTRVQVIPASLDPDSITFAPGSSGLSAAPGTVTTARLSAVAALGSPVFGFSSVEVTRSDGSHGTLAGHWRLALTVPPDIAARLRTEALVSAPASDAGVMLGVEGALRSATETLVTVRITSSEAVSQLGQPTLVVDGQQLFGGVVAAQEGGTLITYSFPPTPFGSAVQVQFGPFTKVGATEAGTATVDLAAVIARNGLKGDDGETAAVGPEDALGTSGALGAPTSIRFSTLFNSTALPGRHWTTTVTLPGALGTLSAPDAVPPTFTVVGVGGKQLDVVSHAIGYHKDAANVTSNPFSDVTFLIDSLDDIRGPVTISFTGQPQDTIRGNWTITLKPGP